MLVLWPLLAFFLYEPEGVIVILILTIALNLLLILTALGPCGMTNWMLIMGGITYYFIQAESFLLITIMIVVYIVIGFITFVYVQFFWDR